MFLRQYGLHEPTYETFYLKASPETLHAHLKMGKGVRPLLLNKTPEEVDKFIHEQLKLREPYYEKAKTHHRYQRDGQL